MRPVNEKLRADLLEAGKREFMENGFRGASLKSIAASLGVNNWGDLPLLHRQGGVV